MRGLHALAGVVCLCAAGVYGGGRENKHHASRKSGSHNHDAQKGIGVKQVQNATAAVAAPTHPPTHAQATPTPTRAPVARAPTFGGGYPWNLWPPLHPRTAAPTPAPTPVNRPKPWWFRGHRPGNATLPGDEVLAANYTLFESENGTSPNIKMYLPSAPIHYNESLESWYVITNTLDFKLNNVTLEVDISDRKGVVKSPVTVPSVDYDWREVGGFFMPKLDPGESFVVQVWVWCIKKRIKHTVTITHTATLFPPDEELAVANGTSSGNLPLKVTAMGTMIAEPGPGPEYGYERPNEYGVNDPHYYDKPDEPETVSPTPAPWHNLFGPRPVQRPPPPVQHGTLPPGQHDLPPQGGLQHGYRPPVPPAAPLPPRPPVPPQHGVVAPPHRPGGGSGLGTGGTRDAPVDGGEGGDGSSSGEGDHPAGGAGADGGVEDSGTIPDEPVSSAHDVPDQPDGEPDDSVPSNTSSAQQSEHTTAAPDQEAVPDTDEGSGGDLNGDATTAPASDVTESDDSAGESVSDTTDASDGGGDNEDEDGERSSVSVGGMVMESGDRSPSATGGDEGDGDDGAAHAGEAESGVSSQGGSEGDDSAHKTPLDAASSAAAPSNGGGAAVANQSSELHAAVTDQAAGVVKGVGKKQRHSRSHGGKKASRKDRVAGSPRYRKMAGFR